MELFTWTFLATFAGCAALTALFTQFLKGLVPIETRILSYILAVLIFNAAFLAMGNWTWQEGLLTLANGLLVSLATNGGYDAYQRLRYGTGAGEDKEPQGDEEKPEDGGEGV